MMLLGGKKMSDINITQSAISQTCKELEQFLLEKNKRYGDSACNPVRTFSKAPADAQILVRLDDKLSRIGNSDELRKNDIVDLMGYLVLLCVKKEWLAFSDLID